MFDPSFPYMEGETLALCEGPTLSTIVWAVQSSKMLAEVTDCRSRGAMIVLPRSVIDDLTVNRGESWVDPVSYGAVVIQRCRMGTPILIHTGCRR